MMFTKFLLDKEMDMLVIVYKDVFKIMTLGYNLVLIGTLAVAYREGFRCRYASLGTQTMCPNY